MNKIVQYLQLALKAGKLKYGSSLIPAIQKKEVLLVVFSDQTGSNQRKKLLDKCRFYQVPIYELPGSVFDRVSADPRIAYGICEKNFSTSLLELLKIHADQLKTN